MRTIKHRTGVLAISLSAAAFVACDVESMDDTIDDEVLAESAGFQVVEYEVIAEVMADDDTTITFTREPVGDHPDLFAVGLKLVGSNDGVAYEKLIAEQGLSAMEVFLAFAPDGAEVPAELLVSHEMTARAQKRDSVELRELMIPREISVVTAPFCDKYQEFVDYFDSYWVDHGDTNDFVTAKSHYNHSVQKNHWHSAAGNACNEFTLGISDNKTVYMCARASSDTRDFPCESVLLNNNLRAYKVWFPVYIGGEYYQLWDYKVMAENAGGNYVMSYISLHVAGWTSL